MLDLSERGFDPTGQMTRNTPPLVSIVTPVLNRRSTIDRCLESVSRQSFPNIEHIVIDGGSDDGTAEAVREFTSPYPLRLVQETDEGMYDAINKGMRLAKGDIFAYLNSDDMYMPWSVESAVGGLVEGTDLVFGDLALLLEDGPSVRRFELAFFDPFDITYYVHLRTLAQPTVFWHRRVFEQIGGFDESYRLIADCEYWARAAEAGARFLHLDEILAVQVDHEETLRARNPGDLDREFKRLRESYRASAPSRWRHQLEPVHWRVAWRKRLLAFRREAKRRYPRRWGRFIAYLRNNDIKIDDTALLLFLLPKTTRPLDREWLDVSRLVKQLTRGVSSHERGKES